MRLDFQQCVLGLGRERIKIGFVLSHGWMCRCLPMCLFPFSHLRVELRDMFIRVKTRDGDSTPNGRPCVASTMLALAVPAPSDPLDEVCQLLSGNRVEELDLTGTKARTLTDDDVALLAPCLRTCTTLRSLNLSLNHVTDHGALLLAGALAASASSGSALQELNLSSNRLSDTGAVALLQALPPGVVALDLSGNCLTSATLDTLVEGCRAHRLSLRSVHLRDAMLEDRCWGASPALPSSFTSFLLDNAACTLQTLHISGNKFTEKSVPHIVRIVATNDTLTTFNVCNSAGIRDYFPIASAIHSNDRLLLFPLAVDGRRFESTVVDAKLKENHKKYQLAAAERMVDALRWEHTLEVRKLQRQHEADVAALRSTIATLEAEVAMLRTGR